MNTPNPLIPQGTLNHASRGASNLRIAVVTIAAIHVVFFGGLLLQGCKRDPKVEVATNNATNQEPATASTTAAGTGTSSYGPIDPSNTLYYSNPSSLPTESGNSSVSSGSTPRTDYSSIGAGSATPDAGLTTPSPSVMTTPGPTAEARDYVVVKNDSFYKIAKQNGITVAALTRANPNIDPARLKVGAKLKIPAPEAATAGGNGTAVSADSANVYTVKSGDTLTRIANAQGVSVSELRSANGLKTSRLNVGQKLKIPAKTSGGSNTPSPLQVR